ncbi:hypothetical protein LTR96_009239 [Exophiala xenobiotica]|nr:hypothetical protein LTR96_009239 [Exophiala xenobiotica]KAK5344002.1 hypothetical protein LTR98_001635 [Exophiala xenobiotica]
MADFQQSVLVIGAGTWGCSTALYLARRGYKNVTVLDLFEPPSPLSAGNDVNKIVQSRPLENTSSKAEAVRLKLQALAAPRWRNDPVFGPYFHESGYVICAQSAAGKKRLPQASDLQFEPLNTPEDFRRTMPAGVLTGSFKGWQGGWKKTGAGWVFARGALVSAYREAQRLGVKFVFGDDGNVTRLELGAQQVEAVVTASGKRHFADTVVLANGARAPELLDLEGQLRPTAWTVSHIKLTQEELRLYKNLPVFFNIESGFFIEPDEEKGELKICDEHPGYCNFVRQDERERLKSVAYTRAREEIPGEAEQRTRMFLRDTMPHLATRPLSFAKICWCADTPDRQFLIDRHPRLKNLVVATGGSGHGFHHIVTVGDWIADILEGKMDPDLAEMFRWRPETAVGRDLLDTQGRIGGSNRIMDLQEVKEWTRIEQRPWKSVL